MGVTELVFELLSLKAKIRRVFNRFKCCYENLKKFHNLFTKSIGHFFDTTIMAIYYKFWWQ